MKSSPDYDHSCGDDVPNLKITTNMPEDDNRLAAIYRVLERLGLIDLASPEGNLDKSAFEIEVSGVILPLDVEVTKTSSPGSPRPNSIIEVRVTVTNLDSSARDPPDAPRHRLARRPSDLMEPADSLLSFRELIPTSPFST